MCKKGKVSKLFSVELIPLLGFSSGERLQKKWKWRKIISYLPQFSFPSQFCIWSGKALTTLIEFWRLNFPFCTFKPLFKFQGHSQCQNFKPFILGDVVAASPATSFDKSVPVHKNVVELDVFPTPYFSSSNFATGWCQISSISWYSLDMSAIESGHTTPALKIPQIW